jgi:Tol biopolymer transport system component
LLLAIGSSYYFYSSEPPIFPYAFASDRQGMGDIFVVDTVGQLHNLTNHPDGDWDPTWASTGTTLAFTSHRAGNSDIWVLKNPGQEIDLKTQLFQKTMFWIDEIEPMNKPYNLTHHPAWDYSPTWSPTGQTIAFVSERDGDPEIFIQHLEEDTAIQLTFNEETDRLPAWSPDGKYIAFAAIRDGMEKIHRIRPDGTDEQLLTPHPIQGTSPTWATDSQRLAFVGWDEVGRPGIYLIGPDVDDLELLYQADGWIGSLDWSADGEWLTFTAWQNGNHELLALPATGGVPHQITNDAAWDDFLVINPKAQFVPSVEQGVAQAAPAHRPPPNPNFAMGVNIADLSKAYLINDLGFDWAKGYVNWATVEPEPGKFRWVDPDNVVQAFGDQELKILMRIHGTPAWNRPPDTALSHPPVDLEKFADFLTALATRYKGQVAAYEIWNEPNLNYEWGYQSPDPVAYTKMLQTAYTAIKQADPAAVVVSGGLSTTGDGSPTAYGDLAFLQGMYDAGAQGYFDVLGSHPYSFGNSPDKIDPYGLSLSRVVEQHELMLANGDSDTPVWITEVGWVINASWDLDEHEAISVSQEQQAEYLAQTYRKVQQDWPFVKGVFLFNLDFSTVTWYPSPEPMRWYAILNPDGTPRPAYTKLRELRR